MPLLILQYCYSNKFICNEVNLIEPLNGQVGGGGGKGANCNTTYFTEPS